MSGMAIDMMMNKILMDASNSMSANGISEETTIVMLFRRSDGQIGSKVMLNPAMGNCVSPILIRLAQQFSSPEAIVKGIQSQDVGVTIAFKKAPSGNPTDKVMDIDMTALAEKVRVALKNEEKFGRNAIIEEFVLMRIHNAGTTVWKPLNSDQKRQSVLDMMAIVRTHIRDLPNDFTADEIDMAIQNVEQARGL